MNNYKPNFAPLSFIFSFYVSFICPWFLYFLFTMKMILYMEKHLENTSIKKERKFHVSAVFYFVLLFFLRKGETVRNVP